MGQYNLKKDLAVKNPVVLKWHGEDTKVLVYGNAEKTVVKKGDTLEVSEKQAKELLSYSYLWTLDGDKPLNHAYDAAIKNRQELSGSEDEEEGGAGSIDQMSKKEIVAELKARGVSCNSNANRDSLAELLKETLAGENEAAEDEEEASEESEDESEDEEEAK